MEWQGITEQEKPRFHHATLFHSGEEGFLDGALPFIKEAVAAGEPVLVAVSSARIELLRTALDDEAEHVHFADMHVLGGNPARIIPAWRRFLAEHAADASPARGIGEPIWAGRSDAELTECQRHESLLNVAFDGGQAWQLLCPYDLEALDERVIAEARRSHPFIAREGASYASEEYLHANEEWGPFDGGLPAPAGAELGQMAFTHERLGELRRYVLEHAAPMLGSARAEDLLLAVNELATNSLCHGGGEGTLRIWTEPGVLLCEVRDSGHITERLVGRNPPVAKQSDGRGLWVVNHLCDLVQIRSAPHGSVVRVHMRLT
jgi:anti-sigma regulatory factor (Ser/Thr protein kinase)